MTTHHIDVVFESTCTDLPEETAIQRWAHAALQAQSGSLAIKVIDETEMTQINHRFAGKNKATNVLSFPCDDELTMIEESLGDIAICAPVVQREAQEQGKESAAHWAHMTVHGVLHLRGYDHVSVADAEEMEGLEVVILSQLGFPDPYQSGMPGQSDTAITQGAVNE